MLSCIELWLNVNLQHGPKNNKVPVCTSECDLRLCAYYWWLHEYTGAFVDILHIIIMHYIYINLKWHWTADWSHCSLYNYYRNVLVECKLMQRWFNRWCVYVACDCCHLLYCTCYNCTSIKHTLRENTQVIHQSLSNWQANLYFILAFSKKLWLPVFHHWLLLLSTSSLGTSCRVCIVYQLKGNQLQ